MISVRSIGAHARAACSRRLRHSCQVPSHATLQRRRNKRKECHGIISFVCSWGPNHLFRDLPQKKLSTVSTQTEFPTTGYDRGHTVNNARYQYPDSARRRLQTELDLLVYAQGALTSRFVPQTTLSSRPSNVLHTIPCSATISRHFEPNDSRACISARFQAPQRDGHPLGRVRHGAWLLPHHRAGHRARLRRGVLPGKTTKFYTSRKIGDCHNQKPPRSPLHQTSTPPYIMQ